MPGSLVVYDTETTGLLRPEGTPLGLQPFITEFYGAKIDIDTGTILNEIETFVKPPRPIPMLITKLTGISNAMVVDAPTFPQIYRKLCGVFLGAHTQVAHNLGFDFGVLLCELKRMGKQYSFPFPPIQFCTIEQSMHLKGHRMKNGELYEMATGKKIVGAHRAKVDVLATFESYKWLNRKQ